MSSKEYPRFCIDSMSLRIARIASILFTFCVSLGAGGASLIRSRSASNASSVSAMFLSPFLALFVRSCILALFSVGCNAAKIVL